jgi:outer membrane protein
VIVRIAVTAALALSATSLAAQQRPAGLDGDSVSVAVGAAYLPDYEGADEYRIRPGGILRGKVSGHEFYTRGLALYVNAIPDNAGSDVDFAFGPAAGLRLTRTGEVKDDRVAALGELETGYEVGAFAGISKSGILTSGYDSLSFRVSYLKDVGDAHESHVIQPSLSYSTPLSPRTFVAASLSADIVGDGYADYYYSVTPAGAAASGLSPFEADGGFKSWSISLFGAQALGDNLLDGFSLAGAVGYTRLRGDFARSPIVLEAGDRNQFFAALGIGYTF